MSVYSIGIIPPETFPPLHEPAEPFEVLPPAIKTGFSVLFQRTKKEA